MLNKNKTENDLNVCHEAWGDETQPTYIQSPRT